MSELPPFCGAGGAGCGGAASGREGGARRSPVERCGGLLACGPTTVEARSQPLPTWVDPRFIPMTAPHVAQKACSAPTGESHL